MRIEPWPSSLYVVTFTNRDLTSDIVNTIEINLYFKLLLVRILNFLCIMLK